MLARVILGFFVLLGTGCATGFEAAPPSPTGSTSEEVRARWGDPESIVESERTREGRVVWLYPTASVIFGVDGRVAELRFEE